jgi:hypothetical protein
MSASAAHDLYINAQLAKIQEILAETELHLTHTHAANEYPNFTMDYSSYGKTTLPVVSADSAEHQNRVNFVKTLAGNFATATTIGPHGFQKSRLRYWGLRLVLLFILLLMGIFAIVVLHTALKLTH